MPRIPGFPEKPHYNSVETYLLELAKDVAEMVVDPVKMEHFRKQLKIYAGFWQEWKIAEDADQVGCWKPEMGRPECIFNIFSRAYNRYINDSEKDAKRLAGSYALCALIYENQLSHLPKINADIIPTEAIEETLSAPRNTLEGRSLGNWNSGPDVGEIYVIEEFFNRVKVDLREYCNSEENKSVQECIEGQIQQSNKLSDEEFLELTAKKFEDRAKKVLSKGETWHDLKRALKGWFDAAIERLEKQGFEDKTGLLKYIYKNLLHYTRNSNIKSFRGFPDSSIIQLASKQASELAVKFKDFAKKINVSLKDEKTEIPVISKENAVGTIVDLFKKDYSLENEDSFKNKIAKIEIDFISQGLTSSQGLAYSTDCISKQLQAHFEHNNKLIDYIIESLKQDFANIPLINCKEKLLTIADEEYKKLIPIANRYLVQTGLAQSNVLESVKKQINNKKEKVKQVIKTKLALLEQQKAASKNNKDSKEKEETLESNLSVLLDINPSSIKKEMFHNVEKGNIKTNKDVEKLILLMFNNSERQFYYYCENGTQPDSVLRTAINRGDIRIIETKFFYYKHPKNKRDYVHIERPHDNFQWEWEKEVVQKGPMFCRDQLELYPRKIRKLERQQIMNALSKEMDRTTAEPEKEKGGFGKKIGVGLLGLAAIATILAVLFGDNILGRISKESKNNKPSTKQIEPPKTENKITTETKTSGNSSPAIATSGSNSPVTVIYESPEPKTKQITENELGLLAEDIYADINGRPPFQQEDARKYYIGSKVKWLLYLGAIKMLDEKTAMLFMMTQEEGSIPFGHTVDCFVEISRYPQLKRIKRNSVIWVSGEIRQVHELGIRLSNVSLEFGDN